MLSCYLPCQRIVRAAVTFVFSVALFLQHGQAQAEIPHPMLLSWWTPDRAWLFAVVEDPTSSFYTDEACDEYVAALTAHASEKQLTVLELMGVLASPRLRGRRIPWAYFSGSALSFPLPWLENLLQHAAERNGVKLEQAVYAMD